MNAAVTEFATIGKSLPPIQRAELIESLRHSDKEIEALWAVEAEDRVDALLRGEISANPEPRVLSEFRARQR